MTVSDLSLSWLEPPFRHIVHPAGIVRRALAFMQRDYGKGKERKRGEEGKKGEERKQVANATFPKTRLRRKRKFPMYLAGKLL